MGSYTQLTYHIVYATKYRLPSIVADLREQVYEYIGGTIRAKKGCLLEIGGMADHIHILAQLSASLAVADVVRDIKANSSRWMNEQAEITRHFEWQKGYGAFTVSYSRIPKVSSYIQNQEEHHKTLTFQDEYINFLSVMKSISTLSIYSRTNTMVRCCRRYRGSRLGLRNQSVG